MSISLLAHTSVAETAQFPTASSITTPAIDTTGCTGIFVYLTYFAGATSPHFSDSKGNVWSNLTPQQNSGQVRGVLYYVNNPTVGAGHTFSYTSANTSYPAMCVAAFSGAAAVIDSQAGAQSASTVASFSPGSVSPSYDGELFVTGLGWHANTLTLSIDSSFSITDQQNPGFVSSNQTNEGCALAYFVQPAHAPLGPTWSATNMDEPVSTVGAFGQAPPVTAQVFQSALDIITLANPNAQVFQSALDIITIPALVDLQVILRGVKRYPASTPCKELTEVPELPHVKKAV